MGRRWRYQRVPSRPFVTDDSAVSRMLRARGVRSCCPTCIRAQSIGPFDRAAAPLLSTCSRFCAWKPTHHSQESMNGLSSQRVVPVLCVSLPLSCAWSFTLPLGCLEYGLILRSHVHHC